MSRSRKAWKPLSQKVITVLTKSSSKRSSWIYGKYRINCIMCWSKSRTDFGFGTNQSKSIFVRITSSTPQSFPKPCKHSDHRSRSRLLQTNSISCIWFEAPRKAPRRKYKKFHLSNASRSSALMFVVSNRPLVKERQIPCNCLFSICCQIKCFTGEGESTVKNHPTPLTKIEAKSLRTTGIEQKVCQRSMDHNEFAF
jgi:hypothetical protein